MTTICSSNTASRWLNRGNERMRIWVDADACPKLIKEILFRAAIRTKTALILVSNHVISIPASPHITKIQVGAGLDVADEKIRQNLLPGDLVITADIPLADAVVQKDGLALNPRGQLYSKGNIKQSLAMRNLSTDLRASGVKTGGPALLTQREIRNFASELDRIIQKRKSV